MLKKNTFTNHHLHFTGGLPLGFILKNYTPTTTPSTGDGFFWSQIKSGDFNKIWSNDKRENQAKFFKIYSLLQSLTKSKDPNKQTFLYHFGTEAICQEQAEQNISQFEIIAGPTVNKDETELRLKTMAESIINFNQKNPNSQGKLRLTFIKGTDGCYRNLSGQIIDDIFEILGKNSLIRNSVSGFDFSGQEEWSESGHFFDHLSYLIKRKKTFEKKYHHLSISIHAGENFYVKNLGDTFSFFEKIVSFPIDRIGHGTALWLPKTDFTQLETYDKSRIRIIKEFANSRVSLEICPTANYSSLKTRCQIL